MVQLVPIVERCQYLPVAAGPVTEHLPVQPGQVETFPEAEIYPGYRRQILSLLAADLNDVHQPVAAFCRRRVSCQLLRNCLLTIPIIAFLPTTCRNHRFQALGGSQHLCQRYLVVPDTGLRIKIAAAVMQQPTGAAGSQANDVAEQFCLHFGANLSIQPFYGFPLGLYVMDLEGDQVSCSNAAVACASGVPEFIRPAYTHAIHHIVSDLGGRDFRA